MIRQAAQISKSLNLKTGGGVYFGLRECMLTCYTKRIMKLNEMNHCHEKKNEWKNISRVLFSKESRILLSHLIHSKGSLNKKVSILIYIYFELFVPSCACVSQKYRISNLKEDVIHRQVWLYVVILTAQQNVSKYTSGNYCSLFIHWRSFKHGISV